MKNSTTFFPDRIVPPCDRLVDDRRIVITSSQMLYIISMYLIIVIISGIAIPNQLDDIYS
jgi:hypothetical protein